MKLIRDKIPDIVKAKGEIISFHVANPAEYRHYLREKLIEEAHEYLDAPEKDAPMELADLLEVIRAIAEEGGMTMSRLYRLRDKKRKERGGFTGRIVMEDPRRNHMR